MGKDRTAGQSMETYITNAGSNGIADEYSGTSNCRCVSSSITTTTILCLLFATSLFERTPPQISNGSSPAWQFLLRYTPRCLRLRTPPGKNTAAVASAVLCLFVWCRRRRRRPLAVGRQQPLAPETSPNLERTVPRTGEKERCMSVGTSKEKRNSTDIIGETSQPNGATRIETNKKTIERPTFRTWVPTGKRRRSNMMIVAE